MKKTHHKKNKTKIANRTIMLMVLITAVIIMPSCKDTGPTILNIYTGTEGVTINFMKNIPPDKVYEDMEFVAIGELWNKGAYPLNISSGNYGVATIDYDPLYFTSISSEDENQIFYEKFPQFELEGKSTDYYKGERLNKELIRLKVNKIPGTRESPKTTLTASACYPYQTLLAQEICIDMDYLDEDKHPPCKNKPVYTYSGQGAPIIISSIESNMIPLGNSAVQPSFKIKIKNTGKGIVFSKKPEDGILTICSPSSGNKDYSDINGLLIEATLGSEETKLKCVPEKIKLYQNEAEATCFLNTDIMNLAASRNYMSMLSIKLNYAYRVFTTKEIQIQRLPE